MSHRIKWYSVTGIKKIPIESIVAQMSEAKYNSNKPSGFSIRNANRNSVSGEYIERFEVTESIENPLGGEPFKYKQMRFKRTQFSITNTPLPLELENPAAGVSELLNLLAQFMEFNVAITNIEADVEKWMAEILKRVEGGIVDRMRISHIQMSDLANATAIISGEEDVRQYAAKFSKKKFRIDLMRIASEQGRYEISRTGSMASEEYISDASRKIAKDSLINLLPLADT